MPVIRVTLLDQCMPNVLWYGNWAVNSLSSLAFLSGSAVACSWVKAERFLEFL